MLLTWVYTMFGLCLPPYYVWSDAEKKTQLLIIQKVCQQLFLPSLPWPAEAFTHVPLA